MRNDVSSIFTVRSSLDLVETDQDERVSSNFAPTMLFESFVFQFTNTYLYTTNTHFPTRALFHES